ncbi:L-threonylcarbamoyladenylate synthase [Collinsella sp. An2]|uniref:L-threonylcarbamoyladenylate synthase n=1 Tax=Collinsella sp. An2 TaxID=1965585 RepID=UPI000B375AED|nr:L-threonylcarbamoyladenylate synthase [Collinsella sp. An2]OUP06712.1 threonylcarbamoyl-AMP synthase [Collinsella sp. An2]
MQRLYRIDGDAGRPHSLAVRDVAQVLMSGGLALIPTETVYGIGVAVAAVEGEGGALPPVASGYRRIFSVKHRDLAQTVPWLVGGPDDLDRYGRDVDPATRALARELWPGALTIVVKARENVPAFMQASDGTVALRASRSPVVQALVRACNSPLAVTSANTHGMPAPTSFDEVEQAVLSGVDVAVDAGVTPCRDASTIVSLVSGSLNIIRQGALPASEVERVVSGASSLGSAPASSR